MTATPPPATGGAEQPKHRDDLLRDPKLRKALETLVIEVPLLRAAVTRMIERFKAVRVVIAAIAVMVLIVGYGYVQQHRSQACIQRWAMVTNERSAALADSNTAREDAQTNVARLRSNPDTPVSVLSQAFAAAADAGEAYNETVRRHPVPAPETLDCAGFWP